ncbi:MAG: hypothetical protein FRX49_13451 [Trebouxia sp. A1-2]|nr:MAG: hypothetical protein FRX49_13451 [Trebouxia sp. A1-2]
MESDHQHREVLVGGRDAEQMPNAVIAIRGSWAAAIWVRPPTGEGKSFASSSVWQPATMPLYLALRGTFFFFLRILRTLAKVSLGLAPFRYRAPSSRCNSTSNACITGQLPHTVPAVGPEGRPGGAGHGGVAGVPPPPSPGSAQQ